jgi:hypothetical protein
MNSILPMTFITCRDLFVHYSGDKRSGGTYEVKSLV